MRYILITRRALSIGLVLILAAAFVLAGVSNQYASGTAAQAQARRLPVYCVETAEKKVAITFDAAWGAEDTAELLEILAEYNAHVTVFAVGDWVRKYPESVKAFYDAGHTIGLHTYSHKYSEVYASVDAYFEDLNKIGKIAEEQLGFVPCFIRFPGGASNKVSAQYCKGIMSRLVELVQEKGYQYYDWNLDSGDGAGKGTDELIRNSRTDKLNHIMLLCHDAGAKHETVEALPSIIEYYQQKGYEFRAIDRESYVVHHKVNN